MFVWEKLLAGGLVGDFACVSSGTVFALLPPLSLNKTSSLLELNIPEKESDLASVLALAEYPSLLLMAPKRSAKELFTWKYSSRIREIKMVLRIL